jgi:hypothetical protein
MLSSINLNDKSYEDLIAEAISQIPMYTDEWTNFNRSDPGITILQNFSAFNVLQQSYINTVTDDIRRALLRLLSLEAGHTHSARVLLESRNTDTIQLLPGHKLKTGELCFETTAPLTVEPWGITAVYTGREGVYRDITYLLDRESPTSAQVFTGEPAEGTSLYLILGGKPAKGRELILYARAWDTQGRNSFAERDGLRFAELDWQLYTEHGWVSVTAADFSHDLLVSGEIRLEIPEEPVLFAETEVQGYAVRCTIQHTDYDWPPRLHSITANLFEVVQRDTRAMSVPLNGGTSVELKCAMAEYGNIFIYCREEKGGPYRAYKQYTGYGGETGRYYQAVVLGKGHVQFEFDRKRFGYAPGRGWGAVRAVCYDDEIVHHRDLGHVYGYIDQIVDIDLLENIIPDEFCLLVESRDSDGQYSYSFVSPELTHQDSMGYRVLSEAGQLKIYNPGMGDDCKIYLCDCAVTRGTGGNIREENSFTHPGDEYAEVRELYVNPAPGVGGRDRETAEELRRRFAREIKSSTTAVTAADYENIVRCTPGLRIHKVKAVTDAENNLVKVAVKPYTVDRFSQMTPIYQRQISAWLEPCRLMTTKIELQQPRYVPIDVQTTIYVKSYFDDAQQRIETLLERELDFVGSDREFGGLVSFNRIFQSLTELPCVESVYELILTPRSRTAASLVGADIRLADDCLCYAGRIRLELNGKA